MMQVFVSWTTPHETAANLASSIDLKHVNAGWVTDVEPHNLSLCQLVSSHPDWLTSGFATSPRPKAPCRPTTIVIQYYVSRVCSTANTSWGPSGLPSAHVMYPWHSLLFVSGEPPSPLLTPTSLTINQFRWHQCMST